MKKVLIVDADAARRKLLSSAVEELGANCVYAASAQLAEKLLELNPEFELCVVDAELPDSSGRELILGLRRNPALAAMPIILISPPVKLRDIDELMRLGASYFLARNAPLSDLQEIIRRLDIFRLHRRQNQAAEARVH